MPRDFGNPGECTRYVEIFASFGRIHLEDDHAKPKTAPEIFGQIYGAHSTATLSRLTMVLFYSRRWPRCHLNVNNDVLLMVW